MFECWFGPLKIWQGCVFRGMYQCDLNCLFFICSLCIRKSQKYCKNLWSHRIWCSLMMNTSVKKRGKIQPSVYSNVYYIKKMCQNQFSIVNYQKRLVHQICCKQMFWVLAVWSNPCILIDKRKNSLTAKLFWII